MKENKLFNIIKKDDAKSKLYVIVDAARDDQIYFEIETVEHENLFPKKEALLLAEVSPYLLELKDEEFSHTLLKERYGDSTLLFLKSTETLVSLAMFFRKYTKIKVEGKEAFFAFYDPRVFQRFIKNASETESEAFFSLVHTYYCEEAENVQTLLHYTYDETLSIHKMSLNDD